MYRCSAIELLPQKIKGIWESKEGDGFLDIVIQQAAGRRKEVRKKKWSLSHEIW